MVEYSLKRAKETGFKKVFALTYMQNFFENCGFKVTELDSLPKKIWTDCLKCPKYPDCDETAVIIDIHVGCNAQTPLMASLSSQIINSYIFSYISFLLI